MNNPKQKTLIRQEIFEQCMLFVDTLVAFAGDLEDLGDTQDGEDLRWLAGEVERVYYNIRDRHNRKT